jgi:GDPmannose 4,6-dehydratase
MGALITGAAGQDGTILATMLYRQGVDVIGLVKPGTEYSRLVRYVPSIEIRDVDMSDADALHALISEEKPTHVWNFGGFTAPAESWENEEEVFRINTHAVGAILAAAASLPEPARFFQASSSHIFEGTDRSPQDETFELSPASPYARSKAEALTLVRRYRDEGLFAVSAVLYNHESPLRGDNFVTRKISKAVARIAVGQQDTLHLGDIEVARDWGWAPDYVRAMLLMLTADAPRDFVLATGISHRLSFFAKRAFAAAEISDWQSYVVASESDRPVDTNKMVGNPRAAYLELGWRHTVDFDGIAQRMVRHDIAELADPDLLWTDF